MNRTSCAISPLTDISTPTMEFFSGPLDTDPSLNLKNAKVYVINLDRRSDRWNNVQSILYKAGFYNLERVSAIDGKQIDSSHLKQIVDSRVYNDLGKLRKADEDLGSVGAVGCYLSHYKVWMKVLQSGEPAIIAEDDMVLDANVNNFECVRNRKILNNYDMTLLGYCRLRDPLTTKITKPGLYPYAGMFFCLHFYYLTPHGAEVLLSESLPITYQVDSYMGLMLKKNKLTCAFHYPNLSWQGGDNSGTDIQTPLGPDQSLDAIVSSKLSIGVLWIIVFVLIFILMFLILNSNK